MARFVYFVRHGECEANARGVIAGAGEDSPLTQKGEQQARETANNLRGLKFDLVISSPMVRAKETATIIAEELGIEKSKIISLGHFTEKDVGEFSGKPKAEYSAFEKSSGEAGETTAVMQERVRLGLNWLKKQKFDNALLVTHNGTVRMMRTVLENLPAKEFTNIAHLDNGEYLKINLDKMQISHK